MPIFFEIEKCNNDRKFLKIITMIKNTKQFIFMR